MLKPRFATHLARLVAYDDQNAIVYGRVTTKNDAIRSIN